MTMTFNESRWPRENAIKVVKGNGVSKLAVFMDPMCVYCKRLSRETLANLMNVTIYCYIWGYEGVGKTHLVRALGKQSEGVPAFDENRTIYAVDNVQDLRPEQQQELFVLYNTVREHPGTHLVVTADRSPKDFERQGFRKDLTSRFSWGVVFELSPLSDEQKRQVILEAASQTGLKVAPEVLNWIENNFPRDMHTMSNLLHSLDRYAMSAKRAVTIPLIKEWLERNQDTKEDR